MTIEKEGVTFGYCNTEKGQFVRIAHSEFVWWPSSATYSNIILQYSTTRGRNFKNQI